MSDNVIQFPQAPSEPKEPNTTWSFEMQDETGSIFQVTYDTEHRDLQMVEVSDGYIQHLCEKLCECVKNNPELEEYVSTMLERAIKKISG
jgi:hypothetical protein